MNNNNQHIAFRFATVLIVLCLLLPIGTKFSHVFSHHKHEVCQGENQSHFHEVDMDCEFFKFKINHQITFEAQEFIPVEINDYNEIIISKYLFLSTFQKLHIALRAPPINS